MERAATPLKLILGGLSVVVVGLLGFLILQAAKPTIKNPQPLNGSTTPKGEVTVSADIHGEANLREVRLRIDGRAVQPAIEAHGERDWSIRYRAALTPGAHEAELTAIDARGREQPYHWRFTAGGPSRAAAVKFANPLPRDGSRLVAGEALISLESFFEGAGPGGAINRLKLSLNGKELITTDGRPPGGGRTTARQLRSLSPGDYVVTAEATDDEGETVPYEWRFSVLDPGKGSPDARFFPQTGFYVFGPFVDQWVNGGGMAMYGLPITPDFPQGELTVQWFERARFERAPSDRGVRLGRLGAELRDIDPPRPAPPDDSGLLFFPETGHTLGGPFRAYWEREGGLAQFGLPLTEEIIEDGRRVQWFERARFELPPDGAGTPAEVQLGQLGRTLWQRGGRR